MYVHVVHNNCVLLFALKLANYLRKIGKRNLTLFYSNYSNLYSNNQLFAYSNRYYYSAEYEYEQIIRYSWYGLLSSRQLLLIRRIYWVAQLK